MNHRDQMDEQIAAFVRETVQAEPPPDLVSSLLDAVDNAPRRRPWYASLLPALSGAAVVVLAIGAVLLLWRPWGVAEPSPSSTPSPLVTPSTIASPTNEPTPNPTRPADALLAPGDSVELGAVDPQGEWGTIRVERGQDLGGYTDAIVRPDAFVVELFVDYQPDRMPDPEEFGLPDWQLQTSDPEVRQFFPIAFPMEPSTFQRDGRGVRPTDALATYPGAIDIFSTPTDGWIAFEVPRDAAGHELELVYQPTGFDEPVATFVVRDPGDPPDLVEIEDLVVPDPPAYFEHPDFSVTVIESADADDLFSRPDTCTNAVDGYSATFPDDWYTNTETGDVPACSWFTPDFFEVDRPGEAPDEVWISLGVIDGALGYIGTTQVYSNETITIGGLEARRVEYNPNPNGDPAYRRYHYTIILDDGAEGPTFVAGTDTDMADDYELARAVLDRIMASLEFDQ